jgi:hypothetical protein
MRKTMKKIILVLTISAFSMGAYAGGPECAAKAQAACCADKAKAAGATCEAGKGACCEKSVAMKNAKKVKVVQSPKAAGQSDRAS